MKVVGQLVCGPGEADRWLKDTLEEFKRLCDDVVVCFCNAGQKEKDLVRSYDFRSYEDNREWGKDQPNIKTDLLRRILQLDPDWIIPLDADETLPSIDREIFEELTKGRNAMYFFVVNLWNDPEHYKRTLCFWNIRAYKADRSKGIQFLRKPVHCGNAPPYFYTRSAEEAYVPHIMLHKGLMLPEDRAQKSTRYQQYDPNAIHKGREYYDSLSTVGSGTIYSLQAVLLRVNDFYATIKRRRP